MLGGVNALMQCLWRVVVQNGNSFLADDRPGIHARIHEMDRAAGHFNAMVERLFPRFEAGE